ncbi:hypothetical protein Tco_1420733 [Tanacetum coccineum]
MPTAIRTGMTQDTINELIAKRVDEALTAYDTARNPRTKAQIKNEQQDNHVQGDVNNGNGNGNGNGNPNVNTEGIVGLIRWFEKMETVFHISNCSKKYQVKYATCTLLNSALTWWNLHKRTIGTDAAFTMSWRELMKLMTEELTMMCTKMVPKEEDWVEKFIIGLLDNIQWNVITAETTILQDDGLEVSLIRRIQGIGYGVLEFLRVGTTFDIFQNIHIQYLEYGVLSFSGYGVLSFIPLWSLVSAGMDTPYLP